MTAARVERTRKSVKFACWTKTVSPLTRQSDISGIFPWYCGLWNALGAQASKSRVWRDREGAPCTVKQGATECGVRALTLYRERSIGKGRERRLNRTSRYARRTELMKSDDNIHETEERDRCANTRAISINRVSLVRRARPKYATRNCQHSN